MVFNVTVDKDKHPEEITALTAQPTPKLTLETQHVFQIDARVSTLYFSQMEHAYHAQLEKLQTRQEEVVLPQEHIMDITEDTTIQTL